MTELDPVPTQCELTPVIAAELAAAGFDGAREVGLGGFGAVYRCQQRSLDRTVAIKVLTTDLDADNLERFLREQRAMGKLSGHPNIVNIYQVGATESGRPYMVMQYHPRGSLNARIHRAGPPSWEEAVHIGIKMAGALETAHRLDTLHRDVKPANILYSLGATLFCAVTGHAAFERRSGEQVIAQFLRITSEPADFRGVRVPDDVRAAIEHAMAPTPDDRPATAAELGDELRNTQRRSGLAVDDMSVPADSGAERHGVHNPAPAQRLEVETALRVIVAEDDVLLREGLASLLDRSGFHVVGQAGNGVELLALVHAETPDLVVTDIRMPPTHTSEGLDAARVIREEFPDTGILVLSAHVDVEHAMELLASGHGIGYLLKSRVTDVSDFIDTLERIAKGASVVDPALVQELVSARRRDDPLAVISAREREVLALMAEGRSNAGIAQRLWVTEGTVEKHVRSILTKLNLPETADDHRRVLAVITFLEAH
jgi:DNA-binding NarL/FixJ family response regulator